MLNIKSRAQNSTFSYSNSYDGIDMFWGGTWMFWCCQSYGWLVEVRSKPLVQQKRSDVPLFWYATLGLPASPSQQILVHGMACMAAMWQADSLVMICSTKWRPWTWCGFRWEANADYVGDQQCAADVWLPDHVTDDSTTLVLDSLQLLSGTI